MYKIEEVKNKIIQGDVLTELKKIPSDSIDLIFADPPYFMQTDGQLLRSEGTKFSGALDEWDKFENYKEYDKFSEKWLHECRRVLKKDGTIWVIGAFQNIYRIGYIMQNLGFWILNDIIWSKPNPVPNFKGTRFTNANETTLWCSKSKSSKYTFNYKTMKYLNGGKQMKSIWNIGICIGNERIKDEDGKKAHATQKPEKLLENVILSSSSSQDVVLDPFMGSGTTAAVAKRTNRNFIGIEKEEKYIKVANNRINSIKTIKNNPIYENALDIKLPKVSIQELISKNYILSNEIFFCAQGKNSAKVEDDGNLFFNNNTYSIHKLSGILSHKTNNNGWDYWHVNRNNQLKSINEIRKEYRRKELGCEIDINKKVQELMDSVS